MASRRIGVLVAVLVLACVWCSAVLAQGGDGDSVYVESGFVFREGRYIEAPYLVESRDLTVFINGIQVTRRLKWPPKDLRVEEDPGMPVDVPMEAGLAALDTVRGANGSPHMSLKVRYLNQHYPAEEARAMIVRYFESLPYIKSVRAVHGCVLELEDHFGETRLVDISHHELQPPPTLEEYEAAVEDQKNAIIQRLMKGRCILYFGSTEISFSGIKAAAVLPRAMEALSDATLDVESKKAVLEELGIIRNGDTLRDTMIRNFRSNRQLDDRIEQLRLRVIDQYGSEILEGPYNGSSSLEESLLRYDSSTEFSPGVAYSPDGQYLYVYYVNGWQRPYDTEINSIRNHIENQDYSITTHIWIDTGDDDDAPEGCTLANWKSCEYADVLSIHSHGNEGFFGGIYLKTEGAVDTWRGSESDMVTVQSSTVEWGDPPYNPYYALVRKQWPADNWSSILTQSKAIVFVNSCHGNEKADGTSFLTCCGGGVGFGYPGECDWSDRTDNNNQLLPRMNGTLDSGAHRKAGEAYSNMPFHKDNMEREGSADITLCPAYESKSPIGEAGAAGTGHFQVDTYCHDTVPANQALTFVTSFGVTIDNIHWVGSGTVRRIEFDYSGPLVFNVDVTAHADKFHSWGAATTSYHRMDGNRVAPNNDNVTWSFSHQGGTFVELSSFTATGHHGYVEIEWETVTETNNAGFNLYRGLSSEGERFLISQGLIAAKGEELKGGSYSFTDHDAAEDIAYYWLEDVDLQGKATMHGPVSAGAASVTGKPSVFSLAQNQPNPFRATTKIRYGLPAACHVDLSIFDVMGEKVTTLVEGHQAAGYRAVRWDGTDENGLEVSGGIYFYRLKAGGYSDINKMILMR